MTNGEGVYVSAKQWSHDRPRTLVICCSDGRLQTAIDDFLQTHLGIACYDRLYAPGGPAALAEGGSEFIRASTFRDQYRFLAKAHQIEQVVLLFHGAAEGSPDDGVCAFYRRLMPTHSHVQIHARHAEDLWDLHRHVVDAITPGLDVRAFRAEVQADRRVRFVNLL